MHITANAAYVLVTLNDQILALATNGALQERYSLEALGIGSYPIDLRLQDDDTLLGSGDSIPNPIIEAQVQVFVGASRLPVNNSKSDMKVLFPSGRPVRVCFWMSFVVTCWPNLNPQSKIANRRSDPTSALL